MSLTWAEHAARHFEPPPPPRWSTPGQLAVELDPKTRQTPALDLIDAELVRAANTPDARLIISMPPQEGKSQRTSRRFPLWALVQNPDLRVAITSYEAGVARRWGRVIRDDVTMNARDLGIRVRDDLAAQHEWQLDGHEGGVYTAGVGGALTGRPVDCVSGDTYIESEHGRITADEAFTRGIRRIRAYDHATRRAVWRDVEAARRIPGRRVIEVVTESGRTLVCTPDHRVYTRRGYVSAGTLVAGDTLTALLGADRVPMRQRSGGPEDGSSQGDQARPKPLLLGRVHAGRDSSELTDQVLPLRSAGASISSCDLFGRVLPAAGRQTWPRVPAMFDRVPTQQDAHDVLLPGLRRPRALGTDGRQRQRPIQGRQVLREVVQDHQADDLGARRAQVRGLRGSADDHVSAQGRDGCEVRPDGAPHRRGHREQPAVESDHAVSPVPHDASQVGDDTVAMVRDLRGREVAVYDFQVAGTRNFFGNGLLVHNCLIIDDPIKDRVQADSAVYRDRVWDWWTDTAATRLAPGAPVVLILTRWHHDDLAGRLLAAEDGHLWSVVNIPAQADHRPESGQADPLGREPGEFMVSARGRTTRQWEAIKIRSGPRTWASLYQGRPSPDAGDLFPEHWARYDQPLWTVRADGTRWVPGNDFELVQSWDMAFKDTRTSDYVVGQVWLRQGADAYLVDQVRGRLSFTATLDAVRALTARWPQASAKFVEDKANGPAVINALQRTIPGLIPVEPEGSKYARAAAVSPFAHSGNIHLPDPALLPNVEELLEEARSFPNGTHDDTIDGLSQAVNQLLLRPVMDEAESLLTSDDLYDQADPHMWLGNY